MTPVRPALLAATAACALALAACAVTPKSVSHNVAAPDPSGSPSPSGSASTVVTPERRALAGHLPDVMAAGDDAFAEYRARVDTGGAKHVRFTRSYHGL